MSSSTQHASNPMADSSNTLDLADNPRPDSNNPPPPVSVHESHSAVLRLLASKDRPTTYHVTPPTSLLSRLQNFLPELEAANRALEGVPQTQRDIECVEEGVRHIEMNVQFYKEEEGDEGIEEGMGGEGESISEGESSCDSEEDIIIVNSPGVKRRGDMIVDMDVER